jgi:hypothetical protein
MCIAVRQFVLVEMRLATATPPLVAKHELPPSAYQRALT